MKHACMFLLAAGLLAANLAPAHAEEGTEVELDGLKSKAPATWKAEKPTNRFRAYQFIVPKVEGDKEDAELYVFFFGTGSGGSVEENVKRWKSFFVAPEGKEIDDVAKLDTMKVGDVKVTYLDVTGTYLSKFPPFDPNAKVTKKPDYRMIGVVFESPKGPYFLRLIGPEKTVAANKKAFDDWLKNFK